MDDGERVEPTGTAADRLITLQYDFLKHLTSLSLLAIGGLVTFAGSIFQHVADKSVLWAAVAGFAIAALLAFTAQVQMLKTLEPGRREVPRWRRLLSGQSLSTATHISLAVSIMGMSVGALIAFAFDAVR